MAKTTKPSGHRKAQVCHALETHDELTTAQIARACDTSASNVRNVLKRLRDQRRIETESPDAIPFAPGEEATHDLTPRGVEYIEWWRETHGDLPALSSPYTR